MWVLPRHSSSGRSTTSVRDTLASARILPRPTLASSAPGYRPGLGPRLSANSRFDIAAALLLHRETLGDRSPGSAVRAAARATIQRSESNCRDRLMRADSAVASSL